MTAVPTRRERQRTATLNEIRQAARRLVVDSGPTAISLRAIARELGMSAAALYRYFPSLEALIADVASEIFDELSAAAEAAGRGEGEVDAQLVAMARGFRRWSITHPQEFALLFGTPVPGVAELEAECVTPDHPGALFGAVFQEAFGRLWKQLHRPSAPEDERLRRLLAPMYQTHGDSLPPDAM